MATTPAASPSNPSMRFTAWVIPATHKTVISGATSGASTTKPANGMRIALHPQGMAPRTLNLPEWSAHLLHRLRRQLQITGDPKLEALYDEVRSYPGVEETPPHGEQQPVDIVLPLRLRDPEGELTFFSTLSTFGTAVDVTLSELALEAFYPANAHTAMRLLRAVGAGGQ